VETSANVHKGLSNDGPSARAHFASSVETVTPANDVGHVESGSPDETFAPSDCGRGLVVTVVLLFIAALVGAAWRAADVLKNPQDRCAAQAVVGVAAMFLAVATVIVWARGRA
jgi:hypothetical protein